ncbi:hypothetical protein EJ04DRAFT_424204 [Polyplosphaeria fusca]|uniref:Uncharacterized protein n=1 Tax=Polyplosphaeria fusca TaxID=682080 RepID=A0A9P4RCE1_9PLEO|nr:hypothetical protein EJ04DRAFT_424204 [Polyplosphaeria fusca]
MSSRVSSRALKALAAGSKQTQTRGLHMTGPATFSSLLTSERPALNLPGDVAGLRADTAIQDSKRPVPEPASVSLPVRHFNTSRSLKSVGDSSTIDFAYLPDFDPDTASSPIMRVPILPETVTSESTRASLAEQVMLPTIMTVSADGTHIHAPSAMSDVSDNNAIDFQGMAARVAQTLGKTTEEKAGMVKEVWGGFMDDVFGPKGHGSAPTA